MNVPGKGVPGVFTLSIFKQRFINPISFRRKGCFIMPAQREVIDIIARFTENLAAYASNAYNEAQLRREFIDPLFRPMASIIGRRRKASIFSI
jgi:hypothetical protein